MCVYAFKYTWWPEVDFGYLPDFLCRYWDLNSDSQICVASTLPMKPHPYLWKLHCFQRLSGYIHPRQYFPNVTSFMLTDFHPSRHGGSSTYPSWNCFSHSLSYVVTTHAVCVPLAWCDYLHLFWTWVNLRKGWYHEILLPVCIPSIPWNCHRGPLCGIYHLISCLLLHTVDEVGYQERGVWQSLWMLRVNYAGMVTHSWSFGTWEVEAG